MSTCRRAVQTVATGRGVPGLVSGELVLSLDRFHVHLDVHLQVGPSLPSTLVSAESGGL